MAFTADVAFCCASFRTWFYKSCMLHVDGGDFNVLLCKLMNCLKTVYKGKET